jgi:hypothetical protein
MVNVRYAWHHIPHLCQGNHEGGAASGERSMAFLNERDALKQFAAWNVSPTRCFQFAMFDVEDVPHQSYQGGY